MPVQTNIKPKIKQQEASEAEPSLGFDPTPCDDCGKSDVKHLIEAYDVGVETNLPTATRKDLCGNCLVGHDVAVCRSSDNSWCFGEVKEYDGSNPQPFLMTFLDDKEEWCVVCRRPSLEYLFHVGNQQLGLPSPLRILAQQSSIGSFSQQSSIGSFSQSSFSSASTNDFNFGIEVMPLFEESRLLHLANSFSSFEDEEGNIEVVSRAVELEPSTPQSEDPANAMEFELSTPKSAQGLEAELKPSTPKSFKVVKHKPSTPKSAQVEANQHEQKNSQNMSPGRQKRKQKKPRSPVKWSSEEDRLLRQAVESFKCSSSVKQPMIKWNAVAEHIPNRNGKQCRERYVNHLSQDVKKNKNWSPREDAGIFSGFFRLGTKWNDIAHSIRGRTDNHIKNRFHSLRRKMTRDIEAKTKTYSNISEDEESVVSMDSYSAEAIELKARKVMNFFAAESKKPHGPKPYPKGAFGPFVSVTEHKQCMRCCLYVPSAQTGKRMCTQTLWCEACTTMPPYLAHELLRECLNLRNEDGSVNE